LISRRPVNSTVSRTLNLKGVPLMTPLGKSTTVSSFVGQVKQWAGEIIECNNNLSVTSLQRKVNQETLKKAFAQRGVTFWLHGDDSPGPHFNNTHVHFVFDVVSLVEGTATVQDVYARANYPISLSHAASVKIDFQPQPLTDREMSAGPHTVGRELLDVTKGQQLPFRGRVRWAKYYFSARAGQPEFELGVVAVRAGSGLATFLARMFR
jgi:hypothetical protein